MHVFRIAFLFGFACLVGATTVVAESPRVGGKDVSGTWRWDFEYQGDTIKNLLTLKQDDKGRLQGTLEADDTELKILDGVVKDGVITFGIEFDLEGMDVRGEYEGKVTAGKLDGNTNFSTGQGEQAFAWKAVRSLEPNSIVGTWIVETETPEGTVSSEMKLVEKNGKLTAINKSPSVEPYESDSVKIKDGKLIVMSTTDYQGAELALTMRASFVGNKMTGIIEYDIDGNTGEMTCEGIREKSTVPKSAK